MGLLDKAYSAGAAKLNHVNLLVYGLSGVGKTRFGSRCGERPLVLLTEPNGATSVREGNRDATILDIGSWAELQQVYVELNQRIRNGDFPWDCVVLDSVTEAQRKLEDDIVGASKDVDLSAAAPDDKLVTRLGGLTKAGWGAMAKRMMAMLRAFRDLDTDFVCIALANEATEDDLRYTRIGLSGSSVLRDLPGIFNTVCYAFTDGTNLLADPSWEQGAIQRILLTDSASARYTTKGHPALKQYESMDQGRVILDRVRSHWMTAEQAPVASGLPKPKPAPEPVNESAHENEHGGGNGVTGPLAQPEPQAAPSGVENVNEGGNGATKARNIGDAGARVIRDLCAKAGRDERDILTAAGIERLEDLSTGHYSAVVRRLSSAAGTNVGH